MKRFRYEWVGGGNVEALNQRLVEGWQPAREVPLHTPPDSESGGASALVVLEREDELPLATLESLPGGVTRELLARMELLEGLTDGELREVLGACQLQRYAADESVFEEAQEEQRLYLLTEGRVSIQLPGLSLEDPVVLEAGPGDVFGESSFFCRAPHATRAVALTSVQVLVLSREKFDELLQGRSLAASKLAVNAAGILGQRLHGTDAWVRDLMQGQQSTDFLRRWRRFRHDLSAARRGPGAGGFIRI